MALSRNQQQVLAFLVDVPEELAGIEVAKAIGGLGQSSTYAALAALQRDGYVSARWDHTQGHPRRLFKITALGKQVLQHAQQLTGPNLGRLSPQKV